jgi:hypothetical protein
MLVALSGCAGMSEGPVPVSDSIDPRTQPIRTAMQDECRVRASARRSEDPNAPPFGTPEEMRIRRNSLVTAFVDAANESYYAYERDLLAFSRQNELGAAIATQLLSAVGAASGSQAVSQATNITSGAVSGTQSAFAKSLLNQTVSIIQTHMRASRAAQNAIIIEHLALPYADWNMCQALWDARAYEQAGTLNAALAAMAASAADEERDNNADVQQAIDRVAFTENPLVDALRDYFAPGEDDALMTTRMGKAQALLTAAHLAVPAGMTPGERLMRILDGTQDAELRALAFAVIQAEQVQSAKAPIVRALTQGNGG